jgi:hypothetical protein
MEEVPEGEELDEGSDPEVGNTAGGHRISARNKTSRSSARGVAAGETRSALREVTARRERPATSRKALCRGGNPLNETTRARLISTSPNRGSGRSSSSRGLKPQDRERQVNERRPAGHGKKELCSGISHKGIKSANFRPENRLTDVRADESSPVPGNTHGRRRYESVGSPTSEGTP